MYFLKKYFHAAVDKTAGLEDVSGIELRPLQSLLANTIQSCTKSL